MAIDPEHAMCTQEEHAQEGNQALKSWRRFLGRKEVTETTWGKVEEVPPGKNERYDLVLANDSVRAYFANGLIVRSRECEMEAGYDYHNNLLWKSDIFFLDLIRNLKWIRLYL